MSKTKIEWTGKNGHTYNPITGCTPISPGCDNCYAAAMNKRFFGGDFSVKFHPDRLEQPMKRKKPTLFFVCSMGDLFHEDVKWAWVDRIMKIMVECPRHHFLILTKRPNNMKKYFEHVNRFYETIHKENSILYNILHNEEPKSKYEYKPLPNLWLGVTAENQEQADQRIPILLDIPSAGHFVSCEPLLGHIDLRKYLLNNPEGVVLGKNYLDFTIAGPETGTGARPMQQEWIDNIRHQCNYKMNLLKLKTCFFHKKDERYREIPVELRRFF